MDNEQIKNTIDYFKESGETIRVRDIAYALLSRMFADSKTAYQCLFGSDGYEEYVTDDIRGKVEDYLTQQGFIKSFSTDADTGGISFEENRKEMEMLLAKTQRALDDGLIEPKDGLKILADIRVKLNDKFKVQEQTKDRMIIVEKKFDFVCPYTKHECYQLDKEVAMKKWDLIEKQ